MWNNLLDYWKSFLSLGQAISLPLFGILFLSTKTFNWTKPSGYYTKLKLFITKKNGNSLSSGTKTADLVAEYPTTNLDKASYWKYCLPQKSQLKTQSTSIVTSSSTSEDCQLEWNKSSDSDLVGYLLKLGLKFLKLRHQINLFLIYSLWDKVQEDNHFKNEMTEKCGLKGRNKKEYLKDFFVSTTPISKNCLLVPEEVTMNLTLSESTQQTANTQQSEIKLEELQKGEIEGKVKYSLADYWGKLHNFSLETRNGGASQGNTKSPISIEVHSKSFEFKLNNSTSSDAQSNGKLDFESLFKKYEKKELELCDFGKDLNTLGGDSKVACKSSS